MSNIVDYFKSYMDLSSKIYWILYEGAPEIVHWFITPLAESSDDPILEIIGEFSPLEITFGVGIMLVLTLGVVKFFMSLSPT